MRIVPAVGAVIGGVISLLAWPLDIPRLADWFNTGVSTQPNTALLIALAGAGVLLLEAGFHRLVTALGVLIGIAGAVTLTQHVVGADFGFNHQLLFDRSWGQASTVTRGRMGPPASTSLALLGMALAIVSASRLGYGGSARPAFAGAVTARRFVPVIGVAVCAFMLFSLAGYLFGARQFYTVPWLSAIALQSSSMLLALAVALIATVPDHHPMLLLRERTSAGQLGRILLPILILVPLLGVWIRAKGHDEGWFDTGTGRAVNSIALIITITSIMWVALLHLRRSERALRESEGQFRRMANAAPAMLWVTHPDGSLAFLSRGWFVYTGQSEEEAAGFGWLKAVHPEDRERSGRIFREANETQEPFELDYRLRRADGVYRWCIDSGRPRREDSSGEFLGFVGSVIDVHERSEAEQLLHCHMDTLEETVRARTEEVLLAQHRLASAERMASIGTLASGLAHDIDNIILPLAERLEPLLSARNFSEEQRANFVVILALLDHLRLISRNLSLFARDPNDEGIIGSTELSAWWTSVRSLIEASVSGRLGVRSGAAIRLLADVPSGLPPVNLAPHRITQAVLQLAQNSREAILALRAKNPRLPHDRGSITIRAERAGDGHHVLLKVIDDGCGMSPEVRARAIEPFFTTKDRPTTAGAGGSGMGLSLVHSLCERAGGSLHIESSPGQGTTVSMLLPLAMPDVGASPSGAPAEGINGATLPGQAGPLASRRPSSTPIHER